MGAELSQTAGEHSIGSKLMMLKNVTFLSYDQFMDSIERLNNITRRLSELNDKQLIFKIKHGSDDSIFWKGLVRIKCIKVCSRTGNVEGCRLLNIHQYLRLYQSILTSSDIPAEQNSMTASIILDKCDADCDGENECIICMERNSEIVLPCSHQYCLPCIEQWNVTNKTCPICRKHVENTDESWVISEKPDPDEMKKELRNYLASITRPSPTSDT